ncbi:hypothetical protein Pyn_39437 [Prunus yedoensis var. nudiflora]|uniref:Uncharacterized protein n=1 Tax=Prunus yedoensis var. nudiflora TaxID=2094558 RepID=A0A314Z4K4_PRUYE|nr:hypothetical protein Pyn_39437 [Prunus yedoensis var. nudiflora]
MSRFKGTARKNIKGHCLPLLIPQTPQTRGLQNILLSNNECSKLLLLSLSLRASDDLKGFRICARVPRISLAPPISPWKADFLSRIRVWLNCRLRQS